MIDLNNLLETILESNIPDDRKIALLKALHFYEKSSRDSSLKTHIIGCLVQAHGKDGELAISQETISKYHETLQKNGEAPSIDYLERDGEQGHLVRMSFKPKQ